MISKALAGESLVEIGTAFGVSRQRVEQILKRYGVGTIRRCAAKGCNRRCARKSGLCEQHAGAIERFDARGDRPADCWIPGCSDPIEQHGLCCAHYGRARYAFDERYRTNHLEAAKRKRESLAKDRNDKRRATMLKAHGRATG